MSFNLKSILLGIIIGVLPIILCLLLFQITPNIASKDQSELVSFGIMGAYALSALTVFIIAMILILIKNKPITGTIALLIMIIQLIAGVSYMAGV